MQLYLLLSGLALALTLLNALTIKVVKNNSATVTNSVSILIPMRNEEENVIECISSVESQAGLIDFEVLVLDDLQLVDCPLDILLVRVEPLLLQAFLHGIRESLDPRLPFGNHVGRELHGTVRLDVTDHVMRNVPGTLDSILHQDIIVEVRVTPGLHVGLPDLLRILRVEFTLELVLRIWDGLGIERLEVEAAELLVDLSFTPVLRTGVVRVTCHNELVSQVLSSGELD